MELYQPALHSQHVCLVQVHLLEDFGAADDTTLLATSVGDEIMQDSKGVIHSNLDVFDTDQEHVQPRANYITNGGSLQLLKHESSFTLDSITMNETQQQCSLAEIGHDGELERGLGKDEPNLLFDYKHSMRGNLPGNEDDLCFSPKLSNVLESPSGSVVSLTPLPIKSHALPTASAQELHQSAQATSEQSRTNTREAPIDMHGGGQFEMDVPLQMSLQEFPLLDPLFPVRLQTPHGFEELTNQVHFSEDNEGIQVPGSGSERPEVERTDQSSTHESDVAVDDPCEAQSGADFEPGIHFERVDIDSLPVMKSPLQKAGRHTVIRGRLRESHPFAVAARNLGHKLVSKRYENEVGSRDEDKGREFFMKDLSAFLSEIGNRHFKIPVIGGGDLDLYLLTKEVMRLGGVQNVVRKRAFRIVAQQLEIPKTCTSAASVLKGAYEKLLFHYEQRLVYGKWPDDPDKAVNMKERVCEEKMKEKRARNACNARARKKAEEISQQVKMRCDIEQVCATNAAAAGRDQKKTANGNPVEEILCIILGETEEPFSLPLWASEYSTEDELSSVLEASRSVDVTKVRTGGEAILLGATECFTTSKPSATPSSLASDLCLAKAICQLPSENSVSRKAQGFLFNLLLMLTGSPEDIRLAPNQSAAGLITGLLSVLHGFYKQHLEGRDKSPIWNLNARVPFTPDLRHDVTLDIAAAYCALRILSELCSEVHGVGRSVLCEEVLPMAGMLLTQAHLHRTFVIGVLEVVQKVVVRVAEGDAPRVLAAVARGVLETVRRGAVRGGEAGGGEAGWRGDGEVCAKGLAVMRCLPRDWGLGREVVGVYVDTLGRMLGDELAVGGVEGVVEAVWDVCGRYAREAAGHEGLVKGVMRLAEQGRDVGVAVENLRAVRDGAGGGENFGVWVLGSNGLACGGSEEGGDGVMEDV